MKKNLVMYRDGRGLFQKAVSNDFGVKEVFWSFSKKGTIRGMHFQVPPYQSIKRVVVQSGCIMDVVVDLREGETYGKVTKHYLGVGDCIEVPVGFAHGFLAREDTTMLYVTNVPYEVGSDTGISWDSIGIDWGPEATSPILSERDKQFIALKDFKTPFRWTY